MLVRLSWGVLFAVLLTGSGRAENWSSFQNSGRLSLKAESTAAKWEQAWSSEVTGYGQSSPVVWGDTVYVTSVSGPQKETYHIVALRLQDGSKEWQHDLANASPRESTGYVSRAAPTPAADEKGLICFFEGGNLVALTHDGKVRWERNLVKEFGACDARHGLSASVEQSESAAFIWVERAENPYVLAVDKTTGKSLWKVEGLGTTSWASPRLVPVGDGKHLVLSGIGTLAGLDPENGQRLWTFNGIAGNSSPTPVPVGDGRFLQGATVGRGEESSGKAAESNGLVGIRRNDDGQWQADFVWRAKRATSSFGSPIAHQGNCYFVNATGVVYCLDLATGQERYAKRLEESVWATPVAVGDEVFFFGKGGSIRGIASGDQFEQRHSHGFWTAENDSDSEASERSPQPTLYGTAVSGDRIVARSGNRVLAWKIR